MPAAAFLAVVAVRIPVMLAHLDTWYGFEVWSGTIGAALLDGLDLDVASLPIMPHIRGGVLFGALLVPAYALFGPSAVVMKMLPLLWNAAAVALLVHLLARYWRPRVAVAAGLLLVFAPPALQKLSVLGLASHMEALLPGLLVLWAFLSLDRHGVTSARMAGLGLAFGFGAFFHPQSLLVGGLLLGLLAWRSLRAVVAPRALASFGVGALVGYAPALLFTGQRSMWFDFFVMGKGGAFAADAPVDDVVESVGLGGRFADLLQLPTWLGFGEAGAAGVVLAWSYGVLLTVAVVLGLWERRDVLWARVRRRRGSGPAPLVVIALHVAVLFGLLLVSRMKLPESWELGSGMGLRRLAPLVVSLLVLAAAGAVGRRDRPSRARAALLLGPLLLIGVAGWLGTIQASGAARLPNRGECYEWLGGQWLHAGGGDFGETVALIERVDRGDGRFATLRYALPITETPLDDALVAQTEAGLAQQLPPVTALYRATAFGRRLGQQPDALATIPLGEYLAGLDPTTRAAFFHGLGMGLGLPRPVVWEQQAPDALGWIRELAAALEPSAARALLEGVGFTLGHGIEPYDEGLRVMLADLVRLGEPGCRDAYRGVGWGYRQRWREPPAQAPADLAVLGSVPEAARPAFLEGLLAQVLPPEAEVLARGRE